MSKDQRKHIFVQSNISRTVGDSFLTHGWSITLVSALFALATKDSNGTFAVISVLPCLVFWALVACFLPQERKFRSLYDSIRSKPDTNFSMDMSHVAKPDDAWGHALVSKTIAPLHGTVPGVVGVVVMPAIKAVLNGDLCQN
jgi:hypothetical protein